MVWLGRRHLTFAVANGVLNRRFSAATVGRCCDGLPARPAIWRKMLFLFELLFFPYISNKPRSQRESCLFSTSASKLYINHFRRIFKVTTSIHLQVNLKRTLFIIAQYVLNEKLNCIKKSGEYDKRVNVHKFCSYEIIKDCYLSTVLQM